MKAVIILYLFDVNKYKITLRPLQVTQMEA